MRRARGRGRAAATRLRAALQGEEHRAHALVDAIEDRLVPHVAAEADDRRHVEREYLLVNGEEVGIVLLDLLHHLVLIGLGQGLNVPITRQV